MINKVIKNHKAFTLVEMLIVISILAIILIIATPNYLLISQKAEVDRVAKEITSMITQMYDKIEGELAYYKYFVEINNWAKDINGKRYLEIKLIKIEEGNRIIVLKTLESRKVKLESNKIATQKLTFITYNNRLSYCIFDADTEGSLFLSSYQPTQGDTTIEVKGVNIASGKRTLILKQIPPGSVIIK